jgi:exopolyphosphatase/guanosine-5'-triphosphate,3'-diphosphate pyrophosphatase
MDYDEVAWTTSQFFRMKKRQMKSLRSMGQARAETMAAGSCVVRLLMKSLGVSELVASTHGLREGTLSLFLHDHRWFNAKSFEPSTIDRQLSSTGRAWRTAWERHVSELFSATMVDEYEYSLLLEALRIVKNAPQSANLRTRFFELMGVDSPLSHVDQLKIAISMIFAASGSLANVLVEEYSPPLRRKDREVIRRLSAAYRLLELLEMMRALLSITGSAGPEKGRPVKMVISVGGTYAEELLARAISTVRDEFKMYIDYTVIKENRLPPMELQR